MKQRHEFVLKLLAETRGNVLAKDPDAKLRWAVYEKGNMVPLHRINSTTLLQMITDKLLKKGPAKDTYVAARKPR